MVLPPTLGTTSVEADVSHSMQSSKVGHDWWFDSHQFSAATVVSG